MSDAFDRAVQVTEKSFKLIDKATERMFEAYRLAKLLAERLIQLTEGEEKRNTKKLVKTIEKVLSNE